MTDYRDRSYRSPDGDRHDDPAARWRRNEERYRREAAGYSANDRFGDGRADDDRWNQANRARDFGYGRNSRDDDAGGQGRNDWRDQRSYGQRNAYAGRDHGGREDNHPVHHWHEQDHDQRAGHPYQGTYGGTGDSSYFTGGQGSWAVSDPRRSSGYGGSYGGGQRFGADYRQHGYDRDDDGRRGFWDRASDEVASWFGDDEAARRREQDHRGHGPKDYTRSDERIREDANDRLTEDWRIDASHVTVTVDKGEITLNGTVGSREAKRRAEDVVDAISGVKHVQNNLRVQDVRSGTAYSGTRATGATATAEGGTLGQTDATRQTGKV